MVGVFAEDLAQAQAGQQVVFFRTQMEHDVGAARLLAHGLDGVVPLTRAFPAHAVFRGQAGAPRDQRDAVGDDERGVEADAELSDEMRVFRAVRREPGEELARARLGNRADMVDDFLTRHADAVVGYGDRARLRVVADANLRVEIVLEQRRVGHRFEAQLVAGVGRVRHQLAQKDLLVPVQGVHHQVQQLPDLGLEAEGLLGGGVGHI